MFFRLLKLLLHPFDKLFSEIPNNLDILFSRFPKVDLMEYKKSVNIVVELPGVTKEDVKIVLEDGVLTLSGEKKNSVDEKDEVTVLTNERTFGKFERKFENCQESCYHQP